MLKLEMHCQSMTRVKHTDLQPGQRFQRDRVAWEVVDLASANGIPHVQIVKVGNPTECKLISVRALLSDYELLPE